MGPWANLSYPVYRFTYLTTASEFAWLCLSRISWLESESLLFLLIFSWSLYYSLSSFENLITFDFQFFLVSVYSWPGSIPSFHCYIHMMKIGVGFGCSGSERRGVSEMGLLILFFLYFYPFPISLCVSFSHCDPLPILHPHTISLTRSPACVRISLVFVLFWLYCWPVSIPLISFLLWLFIIFLSYSFPLLIFELIA